MNIRVQLLISLMNQRKCLMMSLMNQRKFWMISRFAEQLYLCSHLATSWVSRP